MPHNPGDHAYVHRDLCSYVNPSPSRVSFAQTTFLIWVNICVDFKFLQNRPCSFGSLLELFSGGESRGQILDLQWRNSALRDARKAENINVKKRIAEDILD